MTLHTEQGNLELAFWFQKFILRKQRSHILKDTKVKVPMFMHITG